MQSNARICEVFEQLRQKRITEGEKFKAKAYEKAIFVLSQHYKDVESGREASQLSGIGKNLTEKIDEILLTGTVSELNPGPINPEDEQKKRVLELFKTISGVGDVAAQKWYNAGYRDLNEIPQSICTNEQWICLALREHLKQRIPRSEIAFFELHLHGMLDPLQIQFQICGSYRRGRPDSGDIDVLVIANPNSDVVSEILKSPYYAYKLGRGPKKFRGIFKIDQIYRRVDIELCQPEQYAYALVYFTGSGKFNELMRSHAKQYNVRLNEQGLITNNPIPYSEGKTYHLPKKKPEDEQEYCYYAKSEEDVFQLLGLQYLTPEQRDAYQ